MLFTRIACAAALALFALPALSEQHFVELSGGMLNVSSDDGSASARFTGRGLQARGRYFVEGDWFVLGDVQLGTTDGDPGGVDTDLDLRIYRGGIGKSRGVGRGGASAAVWAEFVRLRTKVEAGDERSRGNEQGGGVHLRFDRFSPNGRFLPYAQVGYLILENFDGPEAKVGIAAQLGQFQPFLQYQYLRLSDGDARFTPRTIGLGARYVF